MGSDLFVSSLVWNKLVASVGEGINEVCETYLYETVYYLLLIREAIDGQNADALHAAVSSLKSIALTLGALRLGTKADSLLLVKIQDTGTLNDRLEDLVNEFMAVRQFIRIEIASRYL